LAVVVQDCDASEFAARGVIQIGLPDLDGVSLTIKDCHAILILQVSVRTNRLFGIAVER
jgi:hypothetical protein